MEDCTKGIPGLAARLRVACALLGLLALWPPVCARLLAQEPPGVAPSAAAALQLSGTTAALSTAPSMVQAGASSSRGFGSAYAGEPKGSQSSGLQRVLEMLIDSKAQGKTPAAAMPGLGSVSSADRLLGADLPVELGFYSSRMSANRVYLEELTIRNTGIAASRRIGPTSLYLGAGLEQLRTDFRHPDIPYSRRLFSDPLTKYEHAMLGGREAYRSGGFTPRVTFGAGLELSPLRIGADLSAGSNPGISLAASLSIF